MQKVLHSHRETLKTHFNGWFTSIVAYLPLLFTASVKVGAMVFGCFQPCLEFFYLVDVKISKIDQGTYHLLDQQLLLFAELFLLQLSLCLCQIASYSGLRCNVLRYGFWGDCCQDIIFSRLTFQGVGKLSGVSITSMDRLLIPT